MPSERLQKLISAAGLASRRSAEDMIRTGRVTVNGIPACLGDRADPASDEIAVDGIPLQQDERRVYIVLNKPKGFVTTLHDEQGRRTVADLVDCGMRVYPVGRLDYMSEGLLIMTNDGEFAQKLSHPGANTDKTYLVWLTQCTAGKVKELSRMTEIGGERIRRPAVVSKWIQNGQGMLSLTIHEGKNRQIRRMAEQCGMHVTRLRRVSEGPVSLGDLPSGTWRYFTEAEKKACGLSEERYKCQS